MAETTTAKASRSKASTAKPSTAKATTTKATTAKAATAKATTGTARNRVAESTSPSTNREVRRRADDSISYYARHRDAIDERLDALAKEWDIERWLQANAAAFSLVGLGLGAFVSRRWLALPAVVATFLMQHALEGWCPPVPLLRRMGVRTRDEILRERYALRALRGDFDKLGEKPDAAPYLRARRVRKAISE